MKITFSLNVKDAKKLLAPVIKTINLSTVLPILECLLVEVKDGKIKFSATDLETTTTCIFVTEHTGEGFFVLDARSIGKILSNAIDAVLKFTVGDTTISIDNGKYSLTLTDIESHLNYPKYPDLGEADITTLTVKDIIPHFAQALPFISNDDLRPALTGVYLHDNKGELAVAGTDAHRLYFTDILKTPKSLVNAKCIIPKKACALLPALFIKENVSIQKNDTHIKFSNSQYELTVRLIDAKYPAYEVVIPKNTLEFIVNRKQLKSFLKLAAGFVHKSTGQIELEITNDTLFIKGGDLDFMQSFSYNMPIDEINIVVTKIPFAVNCGFLAKALDLFPKKETVKILHSGNATTAMIIDDCLLLMPLLSNYINDSRANKALH